MLINIFIPVMLLILCNINDINAANDRHKATFQSSGNCPNCDLEGYDAYKVCDPGPDSKGVELHEDKYNKRCEFIKYSTYDSWDGWIDHNRPILYSYDNANLEGAKLKDATFIAKNQKILIRSMKNANFSKADLTKIKIGHNYPESHIVNGPNDTNIEEAKKMNLREARNKGGILWETKGFNGIVNLTGSNFTKANLTESNITKANLKDAIFDEANLTSSLFNNTNLENASFIKAKLDQTQFQDINNYKINLTQANVNNHSTRHFS